MMTVVLNIGAALGLVLVAAALGVFLFRFDARHGQGGRGPRACRCGCFVLHYRGQEWLDRTEDEVHSAGWCGPVREWLAPGR